MTVTVTQKDWNAELRSYLDQAAAKAMDAAKTGAEGTVSDLFIAPMVPVCVKRGKELVPLGPVCSPEDTRALVEQIYETAGRMDRYPFFQESGDDDFAMSVPGCRFRVNTYRQRGSLAAVLRVVPYTIPDPARMNIPDMVMDLAGVTHGLMLITGTAGSGKSTTQACIIDRIRKTRSGHIVTLEDPIEYLYNYRDVDFEKIKARCIVSQREVGSDTMDYASGLRACLREAPDVIVLGEMRDPETIRTAMTAAETGHLVITTMHTDGAANSIDRIIDVFPSDQQKQIRSQLSMVLRAVVCQKLLPLKDGGGLVPAFEVMRVSDSIAAIIRGGKTNQIYSYFANGRDVSLDQSILKLYREEKITREAALDSAEDKSEMEEAVSL